MNLLFKAGYKFTEIGGDEIPYEIVEQIHPRSLSMLYKCKNISNESISAVRVISVAGIDIKNITTYNGKISIGNACSPHIIPTVSIYYAFCDVIIQIRPYYNHNSLNDINCIEYFENITPFQMLLQICQGLKSLKDNSLIHGNLSPSNILFDDNNKVILSDYCKYLLYENHNDDKINENVNLYSLKHYKFTSPENLNGREITSYSDVWSFGCILYYIYTGNSPFNDNNIGDLYSNMLSGKFYPLICKKSEEINTLLSKIFNNNNNNQNTNNGENVLTIENVIDEITNIQKRIGFSDDNIMILFHIENEKTIDYLIEKIRSQEFIFDHEIIYIVRKESFLIKTISDYNKLIMSVYTPTLKDILMNYIYTFIKICFLYPSLVEYVLSHMIINIKSVEFVIINGIKKDNTLFITKQNFNNKDVEFLGCVLRRSANIERLDFPSNLLNPLIIRFLSEQFRYLTSLKSLNLCNNPIQPSGIEDFSNNLFYVTTLINLNISNDMIGDKGIRSISYNLSNLKNLRSFDISSNEITDRGLNYFSESVNELQQLEELNLSHNEIEDDGMELLCNNLLSIPSLKSLNVGFNQITNDGIFKRMKREHPNKLLDIN